MGWDGLVNRKKEEETNQEADGAFVQLGGIFLLASWEEGRELLLYDELADGLEVPVARWVKARRVEVLLRGRVVPVARVVVVMVCRRRNCRRRGR